MQREQGGPGRSDCRRGGGVADGACGLIECIRNVNFVLTTQVEEISDHLVAVIIITRRKAAVGSQMMLFRSRSWVSESSDLPD